MFESSFLCLGYNKIYYLYCAIRVLYKNNVFTRMEELIINGQGCPLIRGVDRRGGDSLEAENGMQQQQQNGGRGTLNMIANCNEV